MNNFQNIPFDEIIKFGQITLLQNSLFTVSWIIDRFCNYNCSYCWPYARSDNPNYQELEIYFKTIDRIKSQANSNGFTDFHFSFSGGEPTAYKHFKKLIEYYCNDTGPLYQSLHMTTNLSPARKWWTEWLDITKSLQRRSITASYHDEFAKEQDFGDKCLELIDNGVFVTINQVMVPGKFDDLYNRLKRFYDRGINVTLKPQSDPTASYVIKDYTKTQLQIMQNGFPQKWNGEEKAQIALYDINGKEYKLDQAERFNAFGFNKFKEWICNAGYQGIVIRQNEVKRSYSCHEPSLGTLTESFNIFKDPQKCVTSTCVSSADSKLPKCKS